MTTSGSTGVTRHLNYAWVEYGHSGDGQAFSVALDSLGWKNLVRHLPRKSDSKGAYYVDSGHPLLPIRWKGRCRMVLPNSVVDCDDYPAPFVSDPLFNDYRAAHGDRGFKDKVAEYCKFLSKWVFTPGIKGSADTEGRLTINSDATDYADLVACSGHGCSGSVWGGDSALGCDLGDTLEAFGAPTHSDRLKYVLIPTCYNLSTYGRKNWLPALRRASPVHGIFGYSKAYPGGEPGRGLFKKFAANLGYNGGRMKILEAFRKAHARWLSGGAILHATSMADTMRDWLAGNLGAPDPAGEIRWFCEDNWPDGEVVVPVTPPFTVHYVVDGTKITATNTRQPTVGLFPGKKGHLEIHKTAGPFSEFENVKILFYYYRPEKDGFDLTKLLTAESTSKAKVTPLTDANQEDRTGHVDALKIVAAKDGEQTLKVPFTVHPEAHNFYHADGHGTHGYYWMKLEPNAYTSCPHYGDGAWLRNPPGA